MRLALLATLVATLSSCSTRAPAPGPSTWHVAGGAIRDAEGRAVVLRGLNLAGAHKNEPFFGFHQLPDYTRVREDWAMNSLRFLVTWAAIEPQKGAYDEAFLDKLDERIGWAESAGLSVVVDMHQDLYGVGFPGGDGAPRWTCDEAAYAAFKPADPWFYGYLDPNVEKCVDGLYLDKELGDHLAEAWRRVAAKLVHHKNVIGFDPLNEPYWGTYGMTGYETDRLQPLYVKLVAAVRSAAPEWLAFVEPGASRNLGVATHLADLPFANVVYSPHSYDTDAESGKGFDASHRARVLQNFGQLADEARSLGAALWIGEYGGQASKPGIYDYMSAEYDGAGSVAASTEYWAYDKSDGYGVLAPDGSEKPELARAIVRPYPERIAGTLASYAYDDATKSLSIKATIDAGIAAPSLVAIPPRVFPNGASVDCGGCTVTSTSPTQVALTRIPAGDVTIVVRPR